MLKQFKLLSGRLHECQDEPGTVFIYINPDRNDLKELKSTSWKSIKPEILKTYITNLRGTL